MILLYNYEITLKNIFATLCSTSNTISFISHLCGCFPKWKTKNRRSLRTIISYQIAFC